MNQNRENILAAREKKHVKIKKLKSAFKTVITVKSNFPGDNKSNNLTYLLVDYFMNQIELGSNTHIEFNDSLDGPYYLIGTDDNPMSLKKHLINIEENHPLGRFIDLDVFDGKKTLSRNYLRKCFLCNKDAFICMRENNHSINDLVSHIESKVLEYFAEETKEIMDEVIQYELDLHPKFGLVTPLTCGSHKDMSYDLMVKAKESILPFIKSMFIIGWTNDSLDKVFSLIRKIGLEAETQMLKVTNGVNAYKGLIFNLGVVATAYSYSLYNHINLNRINEVIINMSSVLQEDFNIESNTFGYSAYKNYNILGARGEILRGIPNVINALEYLKDFSDQSKLDTLMYLIINTEDTVLLKRSGSLEFYYQVKKLFKDALLYKKQDINDLNQFCINHNLSFGGSADLLIVTMFLKKIRALFLRS